MKKYLFLLLVLFSYNYINAQLITNGDMEIGVPNIQSVPTDWQIFSGTPDHCDANSCNTLTKKISVPSPQGGKWTRFFHGNISTGLNNERFGQKLNSSLIIGEEYEVSFYAAYTALNSSTIATSTSILVGFSIDAGANPVLYHTNTIQLTVEENWISHSYSFIASTEAEYIRFEKFDLDQVNACYLDDVKISFPTQQLDLGKDTSLCEGDTLILSATPDDADYLWQDGSTEQTYIVTEPGTYWVEVNANGNITSDTINIFSVPEIELDLGNDKMFCTIETINLDAFHPNALSYLWQDNSSNSNFTVNQAGTYWVEISNQCETLVDTINISIFPNIELNLGDDRLICQEEIINLDIFDPNAINYLWQDNSSNSSYTIDQAGTYWVEISNQCETISDTINVSIVPNIELSLGQDTSICDGETIILETFDPNASSYLWQDNSSNSNFTVNQAGTYWVEISNQCERIVDSINVFYISNPEVELGEDKLLCNEETITLDAFNSNITNYLWQDGSTQATFIVDQAGLYSVEVSNECGTATSDLEIEYEFCDCDILVPDAFSPNKDLINDEFSIIKNCEFVEYHLTIFNQWGVKVYESKDPSESWNGIYQGEELPLDLFVYTFEYRFTNEELKHKYGNITLVR